MIKVFINKAIYRYGRIYNADISEQLNAAAPGEEIETSINSPGREVYEGIAIFNLIREYAKTHDIIMRVTGLAASMAGYILQALRTVKKVILLPDLADLDFRRMFGGIPTVRTDKAFDQPFGADKTQIGWEYDIRPLQ